MQKDVIITNYLSYPIRVYDPYPLIVNCLDVLIGQSCMSKSGIF